MTTPEQAFEQWIGDRLGRPVWDALSSEAQELVHAAFHFGRQSRGVMPPQILDSPLSADEDTEERKEAARAALFYRTLLAMRFTEEQAAAFTLARVQSRAVANLRTPLRVDLPDDESEY